MSARIVAWRVSQVGLVAYLGVAWDGDINELQRRVGVAESHHGDVHVRG